MTITLQKAIAQSGLCSRRQAERLITAGRVKINNQVANLGDRINPELDKISVNDQFLPNKPKAIYLILNKPVGFVCSNRRFKGEKNIFDLIAIKERLFVVGRLDKNSRGLVLLTNDGDLALKLSHPRYQQEKVYRVKLNSQLNDKEKIIKNLLSGIDIGEGDGIVKSPQVNHLKDNIFTITLTEGKKNQIRRMISVLGFKVLDLQRISLVNLKLEKLSEGSFRPLTDQEIELLKTGRRG